MNNDLTLYDVSLIKQFWIKTSRLDFLAFRKYMWHGYYKHGWFFEELTLHLQQFYFDLISGNRPKLIIQTPPQHGKQCAVDTHILTPKGWKHHGTLSVGDQVYHPSGKAIDVVAYIPQEQPCTKEVVISDLSRIKVHPRHEWTVYDNKYQEWITLETQSFPEDLFYNGEYRYQLPLVHKLRPFDRRHIRNITSCKPTEGNCIQVDSPDGLYLVGKKLIPTHNSEVAVDFVAWLLGVEPDYRTIYASYSRRLGVRANLKLRRMIESPKYREIFPHVTLPQRNTGYSINTELIEIPESRGSFRNTTVGGAITGETLDCGILDDTIKNRQEANSPLKRETVWEWFTDSFFTRFDEKAGFLMVLTRWHIDDLAGRLIEKMEDVEIVTYEAIASQDEKYRKAGEPLFPEHKPLDFLLQRKQAMSQENWMALYQQSPILLGGNMYKTEWIREVDELPTIHYHKFITVDTAQKTKEINDYTVMAAWVVHGEKLILADCIRAKLTAPQLRRTAIEFYEKNSDCLRYMYIEDKVSGTGLIQELEEKGLRIKPIGRGVDKVTRAQDAIPHIEQGKVFFYTGVKDRSSLLDEMALFPNGVHDDFVDVLNDAVDIAFVGNRFDIRAFMQ